ncbi:undecaprenyl-phosphate glucose phosphotransferase [Enterovirga aerilata]|uniref:Undecaprenyl-phosphate glucose phosphotransferase n=1 Tax=Enterovirga aerilata TaxID=2730920 RepID=A0A849HXK5_9HYPH|nr:undecaprenyl-phosphate glucose phosphotransferase [Enterovirga sp. DB1703]NNM72266.1 undecaprenyl-phosphate glucose phosphotransferase [Enterovirga sp. DB1703]
MGLHVRDVIGAARETAAAASRRDAPNSASIQVEHPRPDRVSPLVLAGLVRGLELVLVAGTGILVHFAYLKGHVTLGWTYGVALVAITGLAALAFQAVGVYTVTALRSLIPTGLKLAGAWSFVFLCAIALVFFLKAGQSLSRVWLGSWYLAGLAALILERIGLAILVRRMTREGRFERRTAIVGGGDPANEIIRALDAQPETGIRIVGVFDDRDDSRSPPVIGGHPKLGTVSDLVDYARRTPLDLVIFTLPISAENRLLQMLGKLWVLPIDIRLSAHASKLRLRPRSYSYIGSVPVLDVFDRPIADWDLVLKWIFDKVAGSLILLLTCPLLIAAALAVKLDSRGPVLFRQKRYGFNNELIEVFKFRTMYVDQTDAAASRLVTKDDPRVTRVGRLLRKTSIDELPQLFNVVFKGDMSLVGPRPHAVKANAQNRLYDQVVDGYFARHRVKPGITGWAQINGWRGETDTPEKIQRRVEHDLYYIENWSVFFDLYILLATPFSLLKTENAY